MRCKSQILNSLTNTGQHRTPTSFKATRQPATSEPSSSPEGGRERCTQPPECHLMLEVSKETTKSLTALLPKIC